MKLFSALDNPEIIQRLQQNEVGVLPSDTVYGLVACAYAPSAVARLYKLKHREHKPGTLIAADIPQLVQLGLDAEHLQAVARHWPGPVSVIVPAGPELAYLHQGVGSLAVRLPAQSSLHELLLQTGPLLTSSANTPGAPPANTIVEAQNYFGDQVNFYVNGGDLSSNLPSTIIAIDAAGVVRVIRQGAVRL